MSKKLILVRHAHREKLDGGLANNGLSEKGLRQAKDLAKDIEKLLKNKKVVLLSSPRKRCVETIEPLAARMDEKIQISNLLVEEESGSDLTTRVKEFHRWLKDEASAQVVVACSHGDWIPVFTFLVTGKTHDLRKAEFIEIEVS